MYNTKFWLVIKNGGIRSYGYQEVIGIALTKQEAEFTADKLSKESYQKWASVEIPFLINSPAKYSVQEVGFIEFVDKNSKQFKQFAKEKVEELNKEIKKNNECSENDVKKNEELNKEIKSYEY